MSIASGVGRKATNRRADVIRIQQLLNLNADKCGLTQCLAETGFVSDVMIQAIETFQSSVVRLPRPDGKVDPGGRTLRRLEEAERAASEQAAPWLEIARNEIGVKEIPGTGKNNPRILQYIDTFAYLKDIVDAKIDPNKKLSDMDETPWCACFVNWCLIQSGKPRGPSARAIDWLRYGKALDEPAPGAITVIKKVKGKDTTGTTGSGNHVSFFVEKRAANVVLLGGNQGNEVKESTYGGGGWVVLGYRWPS